MSATSELARADAGTPQNSDVSPTARRRPALLAALLALIILVAVSCDATKANTDYAIVNGLRSTNGLAPLARSAELDKKARQFAGVLAASGQLFHSTLNAGVSPGWKALGENVAYASSVEEAQTALQASPPHLANLLNPAFTEMGIGVKTLNGLTYVVQVFAAR
jgi:uncharacterized protein YkwD